MDRTKPPSLILACGNTLRSDDGIGPFLCDWAAERFATDPSVRAISRQQWTPDLAADIAAAGFVLFLDCSIASAPGEIQLSPVQPISPGSGVATHHTGAAELLFIAQDLYGASPATALLLTIGAASTELGESFSPAVQSAIPEARRAIEHALLAHRL